jgi:transposase-like protein
MGSTRRRFTEEYKAQAVAFVINDHRPIAEVARNIGVHAMTLGNWVKKAKESGDSSTQPLVIRYLPTATSPHGAAFESCCQPGTPAGVSGSGRGVRPRTR